MIEKPNIAVLQSALQRAGEAHHDYESIHLGGVRDDQWAGWYAAHVHGHLGDFISPSKLTVLLEQTQTDGDWAEAAARNVFEAL